MKNAVKRISTVLLIAATLLCLTACGAKDSINKQLSDFEAALSNTDVETIADCINPQIVDPIRAVLGLFGGLDDISDMEDYLGQLLESVGMDEILDELEDLGIDVDEINWDAISFRSVKPVGYDFNEDRTRCAVSTEITVDVVGSEKTLNVTINMVQVDDEWYIGLFA